MHLHSFISLGDDQATRCEAEISNMVPRKPEAQKLGCRRGTLIEGDIVDLS